MRTSFFKVSFVVAAAVAITSCDKDFNEIGSGVVGDDHYTFTKDSLFTVKATNQFYGAVQTSKTTTSSVDMPINTLGYYNNSKFGKVTASFVTQLELADEDPDFGDVVEDSVHVKKVELTIPYFNTLETRDDDGNSLYTLDSIQGNSKIKLSIYRSGYYLRDFDPETNLEEVQKYYSDQLPEVEANIASIRLNDSTGATGARQNDQFFFDPSEIITYKTNENTGLQVVDKRSAPQMRLSLNRDFFKRQIFGLNPDGSLAEDTQSKLINNNVFKDYFRGLFFRVEAAAGSENQGSLAQMSFGGGKVTITYSVLTHRKYTTGPNTGQFVVDEDGRLEREEKTFVMNMRGNTVNFFENDYNPTYISAVTNPNTVTGDSRLWLKGGAGSMAIIDLFGSEDLYRWVDEMPDGSNDPFPDEDDPNLPNVKAMTPNGVSDELDDLRQEKWLINDASLTFYIDQTASGMGSEPEALRVYLYDLDNRRPLIDYTADATTINGFPKYNKYVHSGLLEKKDNGTKRYTVRLTNHIRNLFKADLDSTNVRLGLVVTEDIGNVSNKKLKTPISERLDRVPVSSVTNQRGVIIYGNTPDVPEDKKLRLRIYYTKPD